MNVERQAEARASDFPWLAIVLALGVLGPWWWYARGEKHLRVIVPGRLIRGAWQTPTALRRIVARERIKTIVTLTAINHDDAKYVSQSKVVSETGVDWLFVPMRGSRATLLQMAEAADLLADPRRQPVFFHCVAGHHRSSLAHAAYLIRHEGWPAAAAWNEVASLPWARPASAADQNDKALIEEFARAQRLIKPIGQPPNLEVHDDDPFALASDRPIDREAGRGGYLPRLCFPRLEPGQSQLRPGSARADLSLGSDAGFGPGAAIARAADQVRP
jgi:protein tyrosine phosphatase (PTP) superfamily phosphohydrolase (DUF442 family)